MTIDRLKPRCILVLETGDVFYGHSFGALGTAYGELIFNTSMSGYQEILTDPSYRRQLITMTYPEIGNYGIHPDESESNQIHAAGLVVKKCYDAVDKNLTKLGRSPLSDFLKQQGTIAISGVDTRKITRILRKKGCVKSVISTEEFDREKLVDAVRKSESINSFDCVAEVSTRSVYDFKAKPSPLSSSPIFHPLKRVVVIDYGVKRSILKNLSRAFERVIVVPAYSTAEEILSLAPEGVLLSNGPGDPDTFKEAGLITIKNLIGQVPILGICFGHQLLAKVAGSKTYKLRFGHHAANHPVKDLTTCKISITSQNHCYSIESNSRPASQMNLNDQTIAGYQDEARHFLSVQYHPEASPGPHDSLYLFDQFFEMVKRFK